LNKLTGFFLPYLFIFVLNLNFTLAEGPAKTLNELIEATNYKEENVKPYVLPDVLTANDGNKVTTAQEWQSKRRVEILELFRKYVYGRAPIGRPNDMSFQVFEKDSNALGGIAIRKQVRVQFTKKADGPYMDMLIYLPKNVNGQVPIFANLNIWGNQSVCNEPAIRITNSYILIQRLPGIVNNRATEKSRGVNASWYPIKEIIQRGYGLATVHYGDINPDRADSLKTGLHAEFDGKRDEESWGAVGTWAWGLSRAMDYFETDKDIDCKRVAVVGHSRLGKAALWAGAQDERFAIVISNESGCAGAALSRRTFGETVEIINGKYPFWFCENFKKYNGKEDELPVDQHMLIAIIAPRPVYAASAEEDLFSDPKGEFLGCKYADPVYRLLGVEGLSVTEMPAVEKPALKGRIGYHVRKGKHAMLEYDWKCFMDFADQFFKPKSK
jgi:hypothetical protein